MSISDYKNTIKNLVDATNNKELLMQWKEQLEWDVKNGGEIELTDEEWQEVQEGLADYKKGNVISFDEFLNKR
jgi:hypothetical protein